jgi:hypothetical protein
MYLMLANSSHHSSAGGLPSPWWLPIAIGVGSVLIVALALGLFALIDRYYNKKQ